MSETIPAALADDLEAFRVRARSWIRASLRPLSEVPADEIDQDNRSAVTRSRQVQRMLYDAGFAGLAFPRAYGGQGLAPEYQRAFAEECQGFEQAFALQEPTLNIIAPTILDFGSEQQKSRHLPAILRGEERWVQFLSEPSGGSDVASTMTRADRTEGGWLLSGSKIWSTGADQADMSLCPARTNWDVPKHHGITMFIVPIHQPAITIRRIRTSDGADKFCQEFLTDVFVPDDCVVGDVDGGWPVILGLIQHERLAVGGASPYTGGTRPTPKTEPGRSLLDLARRLGKLEDPKVRQIVGSSFVDGIVKEQLDRRVMSLLRSGELPAPAGAIIRLFEGLATRDLATAARDVAGPALTEAPLDSQLGHLADAFIMRQVACVGGGTTEMARNAISERLLGMPREAAGDRGLPFREVVRLGGRES
jgi:hypothetical protein